MEREDFSKYLASVYQHGYIMSAVGLGHDLGLFRVICEAQKPMSLTEIADALGLKERYTKEWLSAMVAAEIIIQDRETDLYTVPEAHKQVLELQSGFAPSIFTMGKSSDKVKECFKKDGPYGITFEDTDWFDWYDGYNPFVCQHVMDTDIIPVFTKYDLISKLETGIKVLEVGCGVGTFTNILADRFPKTTFTGLDYSDKAIRRANTAREKNGLTNLTFTKGDAHCLPDEWTKTFDIVYMYDVLHDLPNPFKALEQIYKVLKDDGCFSLIDFGGFHSNPVENVGNADAAMNYAGSAFICLPSSMTEEPHIGYGACWGGEEIEKSLAKTNFKFEGTSLGEGRVFFCCGK